MRRDPGALPPPWWELAGRCLLTAALGVAGAHFLALQALRLQAQATEIRTALPALVIAGGLLMLAAQVAAGRTLLPGLLLGAYVAYLAWRALASWAPLPLRGAAGVHLLAAALGLAWIVGRQPAVRRRTDLPVRTAAIGLAVVCLGSLPFVAAEIGRTLGEAMSPPRIAARIMQGGRLPDIRLTTLGGDPETLGKPGILYVVSFWASWCGPCLLELPELAETARRAKGDPSIRVLAVNAEDLPPERIRSFLDERRLHELAAYRAEGEAMDALGVRSLPCTMLVQDGRVLRRFDGYRPGMGREIEATIAARRADPAMRSIPAG